MVLYYRDKNSSTRSFFNTYIRSCFNFEETMNSLFDNWNIVGDELKDVPFDDLKSFYEELVLDRKEWVHNVNRLLNRHYIKEEIKDGYIKYKLVCPYNSDLDQYANCKIIELTIQGTSQFLTYYNDSIYIEELLNRNIYKEMDKEQFNEYKYRLSYSYPCIIDNLYKDFIIK